MICISILIYSCAEESVGQTPVDSTPPKNVTDVQVEKTAGGAILTYVLPDDEDLLYVKATFILNNGQESEVRASVFTNRLELQGFGDTNKRSVTLVAVDRSQNESEPLEVEVEPLEAPIFGVQNDLKVEAAFGGINVTFLNPTESNIVINIDILNEKNEYVSLEKIYTKSKEGVRKIRGMKAEDTNLKYYISDRWDNATAKVDIMLTPMFEERVPIKSIEPMVSHSAPLDWGWSLNRLFDDNTGTGYQSKAYDDGYWPAYFTFNIIQGPVKLSRIKIYQRNGYEYTHGNLKYFRLLGRNDYPQPGDKIDNETSPEEYVKWNLVGEFESIKPSNSSLTTNEDLEYARKGEDFDIDVNMLAYKYYRVEAIETWGGGSFMCFMEFQMWGRAEGFEFPK